MIADPIYNDGQTIEWYTPTDYIDAINSVYSLSGIELDPASCEYANSYIRADRYYTKEQDGLEQDWASSTLYLNPPYGKLIEPFVQKLLFEIELGGIGQAILLINSNTSTKYWQAAYKKAAAVCYPSKRISFINEFGTTQKSPRYSNTFFYFGKRPLVFISAFKQFGVCSRIDGQHFVF